MVVKVLSSTFQGVNAVPIEIEVDSSYGLSVTQIVGLPDKAVNESKQRVRTAIENSSYDFPINRLTINLAPADIRKEGPSLDLPIAAGILAVSHQINPVSLRNFAVLGELALDGRIRRVPGILPITLELRQRGVKSIIVPEENAQEAALVKNINVYPVSKLCEVVGFLNGSHPIAPYRKNLDDIFSTFSQASNISIDFADVKGHESVKRAIVVAAAGGHNLLMIGNPGVGKSMIAKRIPGVLPALSVEEALETTKVYSIAGKLSKEEPFTRIRPFRSPHHTISEAGLVGGGSNPRPGEMSLAHNGVLFLDELPEFSRKTLESLRQPLENGTVTLSRAAGSWNFPARFMLVAAMNPCPCGYYGHPHRRCQDTPRQIIAYRNRISGPLLDRIDIHLEVAAVDYRKLSRTKRSPIDSKTMVEQVQKGRNIQARRFAGTAISCNAHMTDSMVQKFVILAPESEKLLATAMKSLSLSPRAYIRVKKLARTIADIVESKEILPEHISEAISYRSLDREENHF